MYNFDNNTKAQGSGQDVNTYLLEKMRQQYPTLPEWEIERLAAAQQSMVENWFPDNISRVGGVYGFERALQQRGDNNTFKYSQPALSLWGDNATNQPISFFSGEKGMDAPFNTITSKHIEKLQEALRTEKTKEQEEDTQPKPDFLGSFLNSPWAGMDANLENSAFIFGQSLTFDPNTVQSEYKKQAKFGNIARGAGAFGNLLTKLLSQTGTGMGYQKRLQQAYKEYGEDQRSALLGTYRFDDGGAVEAITPTFMDMVNRYNPRKYAEMIPFGWENQDIEEEAVADKDYIIDGLITEDQFERYVTYLKEQEGFGFNAKPIHAKDANGVREPWLTGTLGLTVLVSEDGTERRIGRDDILGEEDGRRYLYNFLEHKVAKPLFAKYPSTSQLPDNVKLALIDALYNAGHGKVLDEKKSPKLNKALREYESLMGDEGNSSSLMVTMHSKKASEEALNKLYDTILKETDHGTDIRRKARPHITTYRRASEARFFAGGGEVDKQLINTEKGEYTLTPDGQVLSEGGVTHEQGGNYRMAEEGEKIISDRVEVGKENAKIIAEKYGIVVNPKDTFASLIDKYKSKMEIQEKLDEMEKIADKLKVQPQVYNPETKNLNIEYLTKKSKDLAGEVEGERAMLKLFVEELFNMQEKQKVDKRPSIEFSKGGLVSNLSVMSQAEKFGIDKKRAYELLGVPYMEEGGGIFTDEVNRNAVTPEKMEWLKRFYDKMSAEPGSFAKLMDTFGGERITFNGYLLQLLEAAETEEAFQKAVTTGKQSSVKGGSNLFGATTGDAKSNWVLAGYAKRKYGKDVSELTPKQIGELQAEYSAAYKEATGGDYFSGVPQAGKANTVISDEKFGNRTMSYVMLPHNISGLDNKVIDLEKVRALIAEDKRDEVLASLEGVVSDPEETLTAIEALNPMIHSHVYIDKDEEVVVEDDSKKNTENGDEGDPEKGGGEERKPLDLSDLVSGKRQNPFVFLPTQHTMPPSPLQPHLKVEQKYDRLPYTEGTNEEQLKEIYRVFGSTASKLDGVPDSQRTAGLASLMASMVEATNKSEATTSAQNAQQWLQTQAYNSQVQSAEEKARAADQLSFEKRQLTALANTQADMQGYYDFYEKGRIARHRARQELSTFSSLSPNYYVDSFGNIQLDPTAQAKLLQSFIDEAKAEAKDKVAKEDKKKDNTTVKK